MKTLDEIKKDMKWLLDLAKDRQELADACLACSECDLFEECQEENRDYCEKEQK